MFPPFQRSDLPVVVSKDGAQHTEELFDQLTFIRKVNYQAAGTGVITIWHANRIALHPPCLFDYPRGASLPFPAVLGYDLKGIEPFK